MKRLEFLVLVLILVIAAGFRLHNIDSAPPGLYPDEAMVGDEAIQALDTGKFQIFYQYNNGEEGLYANLVAVSVHTFGNTAFAIRFVSIVSGILTVLGTYLLARIMFDSWELAAMAAFFMATGFWHVNFSRIGFRAIMDPLFAVWSMYYLLKGMRSHHLWHWALSGLFLGLGMYTYIAFRVVPLITVVVVIAYWLAMRSSFGHEKYAYTRGQFWGNFALLVGVSLIVAAPLGAYFASNSGDLVTRAAQVSVFSAPSPIHEIARNTVKELGMFFFVGDGNWRHNLAGQPELFWPVAALFAVGLLHTVWRLGRSWGRNGHPGTPQALLLGWFVIGLVPAIVSDEGIPHALRSLQVAPVVYIMAAVGLHWLYTWMVKWYSDRDRRIITLPWFHHAGEHGKLAIGEGTFIVTIATLCLLLAIGIADAHRYFVEWAQNPITAAYFNSGSVDLANQINALPDKTTKYVVIDAGGTIVNGLPMPSQTVMYLTNTFTVPRQLARHVVYLLPDQFAKLNLPKSAAVFHIIQ